MNTKDIQKLSFRFPTYQKDLRSFDPNLTMLYLKFAKENNLHSDTVDEETSKNLLCQLSVSLAFVQIIAERFADYYNVERDKLANTEFRVIK